MSLKNNYKDVDLTASKFISLLELIINLQEHSLRVLTNSEGLVKIPVYDTTKVRDIVDQALDLIEDLNKNPNEKKYDN